MWPRWSLVSAHKVPARMRERYVLHGYRPALHDWSAVAGSLLRWHNQTGDIYTHLVPLVVYGAYCVAAAAERQ
jgi:adiponectin receptor